MEENNLKGESMSVKERQNRFFECSSNGLGWNFYDYNSPCEWTIGHFLFSLRTKKTLTEEDKEDLIFLLENKILGFFNTDYNIEEIIFGMFFKETEPISDEAFQIFKTYKDKMIEKLNEDREKYILQVEKNIELINKL